MAGGHLTSARKSVDNHEKCMTKNSQKYIESFTLNMMRL